MSLSVWGNVVRNEEDGAEGATGSGKDGNAPGAPDLSNSSASVSAGSGATEPLPDRVARETGQEYPRGGEGCRLRAGLDTAARTAVQRRRLRGPEPGATRIPGAARNPGPAHGSRGWITLGRREGFGAPCGKDAVGSGTRHAPVRCRVRTAARRRATTSVGSSGTCTTASGCTRRWVTRPRPSSGPHQASERETRL